MFSEIWGWRIRIGNLFSADYTPVPFQYMWKKVAEAPEFASPYGAAYQSVLTNIRWIANDTTSPFIRQLRKAMDNENIRNDTLSIRLNVDIYQKNFEKDNFTTGRITGKMSPIKDRKIRKIIDCVNVTKRKKRQRKKQMLHEKTTTSNKH